MIATGRAWRPEIQGLRAVAILAVVGFHAMPGLVPGGFAGVDVFFVISGYLITRIVMRDIAAGRFSLAAFYTRRIARLFPGLFLMLAAVTVAALAIVPPLGLPDYFASLAASSVFVANLHFGREVDYFAEAADLQPLLHTWSLAIEEQFYIFYPLLLLALMRSTPRTRVIALAVCLAISLAWATVLTPPGALMEFYSPFIRAYELLIGCVLAVRFDAPARSSLIASAEVLIGATLIAGSFFLLSPGQDMPGWRALAPCLGCALLIHGSRSAPAGLLAPLTSRPAQFFGDLSYSLYLWHWPVLVFARLLVFDELGTAELAACLGLSVVLAWLSFRFVERPVLARTWRPTVALSCALALIVIAALPRATGFAADGLPERFSARALAQFADRGDVAPSRQNCHTGFDRPANYANRCVSGAGEAADTLLWSDSIGVELAYALRPAFAQSGRSLREATGSSCPPLLEDPRLAPACIRYIQDIWRNVIADEAIRHVVLDAHYLGYAKLGQAGISSAELAQGIIDTATILRRTGKSVVILLPLPSYGVPVPDGLGIATHLSLEAAHEGSDAGKFEAERRQVVAILRAGAQRNRSEIVDPATAFCDPERCRIQNADGEALFFDRFHLSVAGAKLIVERSTLTAALGLVPPAPEETRRR